MKIYKIMRTYVDVCFDDEYYSTLTTEVYDIVHKPVCLNSLKEFVTLLRGKAEIKEGKVVSFCSAHYEYGEEEWEVIEYDMPDSIETLTRKYKSEREEPKHET